MRHLMNNGLVKIRERQNIEDIYGFRKVNISQYECFLDKNISTKLVGLSGFLKGQNRLFPGSLTRA